MGLQYALAWPHQEPGARWRLVALLGLSLSGSSAFGCRLGAREAIYRLATAWPRLLQLTCTYFRSILFYLVVSSLDAVRDPLRPPSSVQSVLWRVEFPIPPFFPLAARRLSREDEPRVAEELRVEVHELLRVLEELDVGRGVNSP